ncbi:MAG: hypothetical protein JNM86_07185 [Phycisphaerae bacterium]|nr:hypothetical protein [Phycisphaerae bacterium]
MKLWKALYRNCVRLGLIAAFGTVAGGVLADEHWGNNVPHICIGCNGYVNGVWVQLPSYNCPTSIFNPASCSCLRAYDTNGNCIHMENRCAYVSVL